MSATPETDALYAQMLVENPGNFIHLEEFLELACRLERERDEAKEDQKNSRQSLAFALEELNEAKAVAAELATIASLYLALHLANTPRIPDDKHLAESLKITHAIKRWKRLK